MTTTSLLTSASAGASASTAASASKLVELANGEYTAASVSADPTDATKLGLTKQKDGNYGTQTVPIASNSSASSQSSVGVQAALSELTLGGA